MQTDRETACGCRVKVGLRTLVKLQLNQQAASTSNRCPLLQRKRQPIPFYKPIEPKRVSNMICKLIVLCMLVASPALGSAVKGYREEAVKGAPLLAAPVKGGLHHREEASSIKGGHRSEEPIKGREPAAQPLQQEQLPALHREEPATKGGRLSLGAPVEQHRLIEQHQAIKTSQVRVEESSSSGGLKKLEERREEKTAAAPAPITEQKLEQREDWQQQQQKVELVAQQKEETLPTLQQQREQQQPLAQQKIEEPTKSAPLRYEARPQVLTVREELAKGQTKSSQQPLIEDHLPRQASKVNVQPLQQKPWDDKLDNWQQQVEIKQEEEEHQHQEQQRHEELQHQQQEVSYGEQRRLSASSSLESTQQIITEQHQEQYPTKGGESPLVAPPGQAEPYAFDYSIEGSSRRESGDVNGVVRGQYTLQGADGSSRVVDYVADANGFRASVNTNEAGTESRGPAGVEIRSSQPAAEDISLRLEGKTREFLNPPEAVKPPAVPARPDNWQVKAPVVVVAAAAAAAATKSTEFLPLAQPIEQIQQEVVIQRAPPTKSLIRDEQPVQQLELVRTPPAKTIETVQRIETQAPIKEAAPIEQVAAEQKPLLSAPIKQELSEQQAPEAELDRSKSAELRAPKSLLRSGAQFESATAHRPVLGRPSVASAPVPVATRQLQSVSRTSPARQQVHQRVPVRQALEQPRYQHHHLSAEVPVASAASGRRPAVQQHQPRFYTGPIGTTSVRTSNEDDSVASFERSS